MAAKASQQLDPPGTVDAVRWDAWIDNLRVVIITGVIGAHVALIYALDVGWYYEERTASTAAKAVLAAIFAPGLLFGMGLMFFLAGLFTPPALRSKGPRRFVVDRLRRLGVPVVVYVFVVNPAMNWFGDRAAGTGEGLRDYFRRTYWNDVELGVAWFIAALLLFSVGYAAWRSRRVPSDTESPLRHRDIVGAMVFIAIASFAVRLVWPFLGTGELAGFNAWEYPQMVTLFVLGILASERGWFSSGMSPAVQHTCARLTALSVVAVMLVAIAMTFTDDADPFLGGLRIEATLIPVVEATIAVSMTLWAAELFRRRWDWAPPIVHTAGRASFLAYLLHAPVTIALAVLLRDVGIPTELKFVVVFVGSVAAAFALGWSIIRVRVGGRIL